jgi:hypothetical protein
MHPSVIERVPTARGSTGTKLPAEISPRLRMAGILLRALFLGAVVLVIARVCLPQSESIWSAYETPGDLIRMALGFAVCLWILVHAFMLPKDAEGYRTWVYLGLAVVPFALVCVVAVW